MSTVASNVQVYLLSLSILPHNNGRGLGSIIYDIKRTITSPTDGVKIVHSFKVTGEARVIAFAEVSKISGLERLTESLWNHGSLSLDCEPLIHYESFARNLGVDEELTKPYGRVERDYLYWMEVNVEYHGKTTDQLLAVWKKEAEAVLVPRSKGESAGLFYKCLAQRKVHIFMNHPQPEVLDKMTFQLPMMYENGDNIKLTCKGIQMLDEYIADLPI